MSSTIYNHRTLQPTGPPTQGPGPQTRINDSLEVIRQDFEVLTQELNLMRTQRDEYEAKLASQVNELNIIRSSLYDLENQHTKIRQHYEDELARARQESRANNPPAGGGGIASLGSVVGPGGPGTPAGGPLAGPSAAGGGPGGAAGGGVGGAGGGGGGGPPGGYPGDPYYPPRDRGPDRERERIERERMPEREREQRDRERERDRLDRDQRDRERERLPDTRDAKRMRSDKMSLKSDRPEHFSPSMGAGPTPKLPPPPGPPGPSSIGLGPSGPGLPPSSSHGPYAPGGHMDNNSLGLIGGNPAPSFLDDLDIHSMGPEYKKEGSDWFAIFNPKVKRVLDVSLVHTLMHESVVCCVRFSADGKYLATGCNRTAQIYDTKTGVKTCVLADDSAGKAGDLYIRSVCFSPDGKYLATGAEDKQIRIWDIAKKRIRNVFDGHQQEIYSLDFSADGRLIVSGSGDKTARIWDMHDGTSKVLTINDPDSLNNDAGVTSVAISPNGMFVAAGSLDTVVRIWDVQTAMLVERLRGHRDSVYSVAFTPDGKGLVSGSLDKTLKYWDVSGLMTGGSGSASGAGNNKRGGKDVSAAGPGPSSSSAAGPGAVVKRDGDKSSPCTMNFTGHKDYVLSVAVSHDGNWVVSGSKDRGVQFWDSRSAIVQCMLQGHKNSVISIDLSPAGNVLATGSGDWQARIWSYNTI